MGSPPGTDGVSGPGTLKGSRVLISIFSRKGCVGRHLGP
jgi:hypothetical protein